MKSRADEIKEAFIRYHKANPNVWTLFKKFTFEMIIAGKIGYSSSAVIERIRWHVSLEISGDDEFKICNDYRAYYSRMFMVVYPEYDGFFKLRRRRSVDDPACGEGESQMNLFSEDDEENLKRELLSVAGERTNPNNINA